jgi:hypothetical protein
MIWPRARRGCEARGEEAELPTGLDTVHGKYCLLGEARGSFNIVEIVSS